MKRDEKWPRWTPLAFCGLIACAVWFILAVEVLPVDWDCGGCLSDPVDSQALVLQHMNGTVIDTFGPRTSSPQCYETTLTSLVAESSYQAIQLIWDNSDTAAHWEFWYWGATAATVSQANMAEIADSVRRLLDSIHGATSWITGGAGSGDNAVRYYAVDTSGTDQAIMEVRITMTTIADVFDASGQTNANGYTDFTAPTDSMIAYGRKLGYYFPYDTNDITGTLTDTLLGYNVPLQASPDPNLCRVQGYVYIPEGKPHRTIRVTFTIVGEAVHNSCDSTALIAEPAPVWTSIHADSLGFFYADLLPSGCLLKTDGDSLQYKITTDLRGVTGKETLIYVPQAESYEVDW